MRDISKAILSLTFIFTWLMTPMAAGFAQETAGQVLAKLGRLPSEERQKALVAGAKAEREVTFYSSLQAQQLEPFAREFNKRYPFLKVNTYRVSGNRQFIRIQTEQNAGKVLVDVVNSSSEEGAALKKIGALDPYLSPQRDFFPPAGKDKEGYFSTLYTIPMVLGYNTNMVKRGEVPKSYADLLDARWKGKMFLDNEAYDWLVVLLKHFGREKGLQYMRSLAKQDLSLIRGRTAQTQLLAAGERPVAVVLSGHTVLDLKARGAPIDYAILEPYFTHDNSIMLARRAPHPHAAALLIDWSLSEEGQALITTFGRVVARKGVKQRFPELLAKESLAVNVDFLDPVLEQAGREFREIFVGKE